MFYWLIKTRVHLVSYLFAYEPKKNLRSTFLLILLLFCQPQTRGGVPKILQCGSVPQTRMFEKHWHEEYCSPLIFFFNLYRLTLLVYQCIILRNSAMHQVNYKLWINSASQFITILTETQVTSDRSTTAITAINATWRSSHSGSRMGQNAFVRDTKLPCLITLKFNKFLLRKCLARTILCRASGKCV
jgi:hypothetical protein